MVWNVSSYNNKSVPADIVSYRVGDNVYYCVRIIIVSTVSMCIIISNILNIYILSRKCHVPRISRIFLLNLSFSDLCVGLISCLPTIYSAVTEYWPYGAVWCQIAGIFHGTSCAISIWSISMVSIDRYLAICKPMTYATWKSPRKAYVVIACLWTFAFASFITPPLTKSDYIYYQFDKAENICGLFWEYKWFCIMTTFYIPVFSGSLLVYTNARIIRTVVTRKEALNNIDCRSSMRRNQGKSAVKLLLTTSSIFCLAWGPYVVAVLLYSFIDGFQVPGKLRFILMWVANSNSFMNVITFSVIYRSFRHEMKRLFLKFISCCKCTKLVRMCDIGDEGDEYISDYVEMRPTNGISTVSAARDVYAMQE